MRSSQKPASLNELLGKTSEGELELKDLPKILGEKMPELPYNRVGRYRLQNALKLRFGPGFRNIPGIKNLLHEFDEMVGIENVVKKNMEARRGNSN